MIKKTRYILLALICLSVSTGYSQTDYKCFSSETNSDGTIEKIVVMLTRDGKKVEADVRKEMTQGGNSHSLSWEMDGTIEGNKMTFLVSQGTIDTFKNGTNPIPSPKPIEIWFLENDRLLVDKKVLTPGKCN
jgi:hypothetical protein